MPVVPHSGVTHDIFEQVAYDFRCPVSKQGTSAVGGPHQLIPKKTIVVGITLILHS